MKKFLSFAAVALLGLTYSQAADVTALYVIGPAGTVVNGNTLPDWKMLEAVKVELNRGKFTMECQNLSVIAVSDKSVETEDWGNWKTGLWSLAAPLTSADLGKAVALEGPGDKNFELPWKGDWKLEFSSDLKTVTCTTTTPEPETTYYLVGDGNIGWSASDTYKFTKAEDGTYWLDVTEEHKIQGVDGGGCRKHQHNPKRRMERMVGMSDASHRAVGNSYGMEMDGQWRCRFILFRSRSLLHRFHQIRGAGYSGQQQRCNGDILSYDSRASRFRCHIDHAL